MPNSRSDPSNKRTQASFSTKNGFEPFDISQILLASCDSFGGDEIGEGDQRHRKTIEIPNLAVVQDGEQLSEV